MRRCTFTGSFSIESRTRALHASSVQDGAITGVTTDDKRLPAVLANTSGFVYYVSITGITGAGADETPNFK